MANTWQTDFATTNRTIRRRMNPPAGTIQILILNSKQSFNRLQPRAPKPNPYARFSRQKTNTKMKRLFLFAAIALFGMSACQKAESLDPASGDVQITVNASFPAQMLETRVAGDGTTVDRCIMQIYLDGELYGEHQYAQVQGLKATFSARLIAGKTYNLVFWADKMGTDLKTDLHYNTADLANVSFTGDYIGNDDARDAFFGTAQVISDKSQAVNVELKRPFGQLNVKTLDLAEVKAAAPALEPKKVKIEFKSVPTGINLLTGELTDAKSAVAYADAAAVVDAEGHLSFDYVLAPAGTEQFLADFTMSFLDENGAEVAGAYDFSSIPVQRNYRTNVSGNLLTKKADINVEVKPGFDGEIDFDADAVEVSTSEGLADVISAGGAARLAGDITLTAAESLIDIEEGKEVTIDLDGHKLAFEAGTAIDATKSTLSIVNGTIEANNMEKPTHAIFNAGENGTVTLDGVTLNTNGSGIGPGTGVDNSTVIVRNSTLNCGAYALSTNASSAGDNVVMIVENSTLKANTAVCVNVPCSLTIEGCTIEGDTQGMMLRGGTAYVSNTTITLTTDGVYNSEEEAESFANYFNSSNWGSGNMVNVAALTLGNKGGNAYQYPTVIDLKNTKLTVTGEYASLFPALYAWANQGEGLGVTLTYDDQCVFNGAETYGSSNIVVNGVAK